MTASGPYNMATIPVSANDFRVSSSQPPPMTTLCDETRRVLSREIGPNIASLAAHIAYEFPNDGNNAYSQWTLFLPDDRFIAPKEYDRSYARTFFRASTVRGTITIPSLTSSRVMTLSTFLPYYEIVVNTAFTNNNNNNNTPILNGCAKIVKTIRVNSYGTVHVVDKPIFSVPRN